MRHEKNRVQRSLWLIFLCGLTFCFCFVNVSLITGERKRWEVLNAETLNASQLVQQGINHYQAGDFKGAIEYWQTALNIYQKRKNRSHEAIVREYLARAYQEIGQTDKAIDYWDQVIAYYRQVNNWQQLGRFQSEQAQAYNNVGQPKKAIALLCGVLSAKPDKKIVCLPESALQIARQQKDQLGEVVALGSLGEAYRLLGNYAQAIAWLEIAKNIAAKGYDFLLLNSLGNAHMSQAQLWAIRGKFAEDSRVRKASMLAQKSQKDYKKALEYFQSSVQKAREQNNQPGQMRALLNLLQLYYHTQNLNLINKAQFEADVQKALDLLDKLPDSANKVYAAIDLGTLPIATSDVTSQFTQCPVKWQLSDEKAFSLLKEAIKISQKIQQDRAESFAYGALGHFYECRNSYKSALEFTLKAQWLAQQNLNAKDSLYLWEWQIGRILKTQGRGSHAEAIAAYQRAFQILEDIRSDIVISEQDLQFDFRDTIDPLYRELAQLKLQDAAKSTQPEIRKKQLNDALQIVDSLKLAELVNFFGNDCILAAIKNSKNINELLTEKTAVVSSIIFEDATAILLTLPNGKISVEWIHENRQNLSERIKKFSKLLREDAPQTQGAYQANEQYRKEAQQLYDLIISPFEDKKYLNPEKINTLVFLQDGFLRNIPMAALHDKEQNKYLIQKYAIATTPSLRVLLPKTQNQKKDRALILGVTKKSEFEGETFDALKYVPSEISQVKKIFPSNTLLVDENFNSKSLGAALDRKIYPVIHIATHAQFGSIAEDTFLVAGNNEKLTINQLESTLRQASIGEELVDLLTLTACETALGDERASLGLAGVALQVGVRSALASVWSVDDKLTSILVTEFYRNLLQSGMSKAEALRQAQLKIIKDNDQDYNPPLWAPFIIVGNWLA